MSSIDGATQYFVDGHVHVYPSMSIESVLNFAHRNSHATRAGHDDTSVLFIADPDGIEGYRRLLDYARKLKQHSSSSSTWRMLGEDERTVSLRHDSGAPVAAVKGQQVITGEGLEVLAIGHQGFVKSGQRLATTIDQIRGLGGLSILAWGVGKWIGRRGRMVTEFIRSESGSSDIMLADNGGRPAIWHFVPQFGVARKHGLRILAGSDPLPLAGEETRIGSYGFRFAMQGLNGESVIDAVRRTLETPEAQISLTGKRVSFRQFVVNQVGLRLRSSDQWPKDK